jgi:hypothetical protein
VHGGYLRHLPQTAQVLAQVLEDFPLPSVTWLPCALPGKDHCLSLHIASDRPRELVLRAPSRARVLDLVAQLDLASQQLAQQSLQDTIQSQLAACELGELEEELHEPCDDLLQTIEGDGRREAEQPSARAGGDKQGRVRQGVARQRAQLAGQRPQLQRGGSSPAAAFLSLAGCGDAEGSDGGSCCSSPSSDIECSPRRGAESSPGSEDASPAAAAGHLAPSPTAAAVPQPAAEPLEASAGLPPITTLPVRLLSFSSGTGRGRVASHVEQLERAVAQLSQEVTSSRGTSPSKVGELLLHFFLHSQAKSYCCIAVHIIL